MVVFVILAVVGPSELLLVRNNLLQLSGSVLSDALFDVLLLSSLLVMARWLSKPVPHYLAFAGVLIALTILTRYAGVAMALAAGLAVLTTMKLSLRLRIYGVVTVAGAATVGLIGWPLINRLIFRASAPRQLAYHLDPHLASKTLTAVGDWFFPSNWDTWFTFPFSVLLLIVATTLPLSGRFFGLVGQGPHRPPPGTQALLRLCALFIPSYLLVVAVTDTWLDATLAVDQRILGPLQFVLYLVLLSLVYWTLRSRVTDRDRLIAVAATFGLAMLALIPNLSLVSQQVRSQFPAEKSAPEFEALARLPTSDVVVTNETPGTFVFAQRGSILTPVRFFVTTERANIDFRRDVEFVGRLLRQHHGVVMIIPEFIPGPATVTEFRQWAGLVTARRFPDGTVFLSVPPRT